MWTFWSSHTLAAPSQGTGIVEQCWWCCWGWGGKETGDERREESGSRAAGGSCGFGPSSGARAWHGISTDSSSHHQHKPGSRHTGQKKPFYPVCVCVRECECLLLLLLTECVEEIGRKRRLKEKLDYPNRERGIGAGASCQSSSEGK